MPKRMGLEDLLADEKTQMIIGRFAEQRSDMLRPSQLEKGLSRATLHRRLDRLCEYGVLQKVDREGNPTKGGQSAPETYYLLVADYWNTAIKCADMKRLGDQDPNRMTSGVFSTVYGLDPSDFEGHEDDEKRFLEALERLDSVALTFLLLRARVLQRALTKTQDVLDDGTFDPVTRWMVGCYAWMRAMAPLTGMEPDPPESFIVEAARALSELWRLGGGFSRAEAKSYLECFTRAVKFTMVSHALHGELLEAIGHKGMRGLVVSHITPVLGESEAVYARAEGRFRSFLRSEGRTAKEEEKQVFRLLRERIRSEKDMKGWGEPFQTVLSKHLKVAPDEIFDELSESSRKAHVEFMAEGFRSGLLDPPRMPTVREMREYLSGRR